MRLDHQIISTRVVIHTEENFVETRVCLILDTCWLAIFGFGVLAPCLLSGDNLNPKVATNRVSNFLSNCPTLFYVNEML